MARSQAAAARMRRLHRLSAGNAVFVAILTGDTLSSWVCRFLEVLAYVNHPLYLEWLNIVRTA
jgi:hypothetical protein